MLDRWLADVYSHDRSPTRGLTCDVRADPGPIDPRRAQRGEECGERDAHKNHGIQVYCLTCKPP